MIKLTQAHFETFDHDGFVIVENAMEDSAVAAARDRFEPLFSGEFETGLYPDEWNWRRGRDREDLTRQICNAWKSDLTIASLVLRSDVGEAAARLRGWPGARIGQDNVIWKPPGTKPLGFHQDDSYNAWIVPGEMLTCWMTLDDTRAHQGTIEYVRGSHRWPISPPIAQFHAPDDPLEDLERAAAASGMRDYEICPLEVSAGTAVFHHGRTWHGSRDNRGDRPRRAVVAHCISSAAQFHPEQMSYIYSRYKKVGSTDMDESYFPILWTNDGYRTSWLDAYVRNGGAPA